jgi:hypothetical protein
LQDVVEPKEEFKGDALVVWVGHSEC